MKLLLCTNNKNKIIEIKESLKDFDKTFVTLQQLNDFEEIEETGKTFKANALLKAKHYAIKHQMIALADDTGLMVKALNNEPGIYSHRYGPTDLEKNKKIIKKLSGHADRSACFKTVMALYNPFNNNVYYFEGIVDGIITDKLIGEQGFGYDPIFYIPSYNKTMAQMSRHEKNEISHRGVALQKLKEFLNENINYL